MNKKPMSEYPLTISVILFLLSLIGCIIGGIMFCIHAFKTPELTLTQNILWFIFDTYWWIPVITIVLSYMGVSTFYIEEKK